MGATTKRSPVLGYNHNFRYRGLVFHVQTEDSGVDNPHIFTHLFHGGVIISTRKLDYDAQAGEDTVKALMQAQHKAMLKDLRHRQFDEKIDMLLGGNPGLEPSKTTRDTLTTPPPVLGQKEPAEAESGRPPSDVSAAFEAIREENEPPESPAVASGRRHARPDTDPQPAPDFEELTPSEPGPPAMVAAEENAVAAPLDVHDTLKTPAQESPGTYSQHRRRRPAQPPEPIHELPTAPSTWRQPKNKPVQPASEPAAAAKAAPAPARTPSAPPSGKRPRTQSRPPEPVVTFNKARPAGKRARVATRPPASRSGVVVSRPAVIIGAPPKVVGGAKPEPASPRATRRHAREDSNVASGLFGKDLISERSLDEVILAYLSEDGAEE